MSSGEEKCEEEHDGDRMLQVTEVLDTSAKAVPNQTFLAIKPNQPDPKTIIKQLAGKHILSFQKNWYNRFPWLHFNPGVQGVLCFFCCKAFHTDTSPLAKNAEPAFISSGYKNWRKAIERFVLHEKSESHKTAMTTHLYEDRSVQCQLANVNITQQEEARACLLKIIGAPIFGKTGFGSQGPGFK